jgi:hypothetical protein
VERWSVHSRRVDLFASLFLTLFYEQRRGLGIVVLRVMVSQPYMVFPLLSNIGMSFTILEFSSKWVKVLPYRGRDGGGLPVGGGGGAVSYYCLLAL